MATKPPKAAGGAYTNRLSNEWEWIVSEEAGGGADVALKIAGQEFNVRNVKSLNTGATLFCAGMLILLCYGGYVHTQESKDIGQTFAQALKEQTLAIKEQTQASREQTCIMRFDQKDRQQNADFCKQIAR